MVSGSAAEILGQDVRAEMLAAPGEGRQAGEDVQVRGGADRAFQKAAAVEREAGGFGHGGDAAHGERAAVLDELERHGVGGGGLRHGERVVRGENALVGHERHRRAGVEPRHPGDVPGRQRLFDQRHPEIGQRRQGAGGGRLVPRLVGVDEERGAALECDREASDPVEVGGERLGADLDLEPVVEARGKLGLGLLDLLRRVAGGEGPPDRHPFADDAAEELDGGQAQRLADGVERGGLDRRLGGVVAPGGGVEPCGQRLEPFGGGVEHGGCQVRVDHGLDALDALLAPARAAEGRGLADAHQRRSPAAARR